MAETEQTYEMVSISDLNPIPELSESDKTPVENAEGTYFATMAKKKDFFKNAKIEKINDITLKYNNESIFDYYIIDLGNIFYKKNIDIMCKYKNTLLYEFYIEIENNKIKLFNLFC